VECNVLKIEQNFYSQQVGIIQGNKLSPKLCSLYFGHLENSELSKFLHDSKIDSEKDVSTPKSLLMRFIDDFIFISFSKEHALDFFNRIRRGFSDYNCYMNDKKYGFNSRLQIVSIVVIGSTGLMMDSLSYHGVVCLLIVKLWKFKLIIQGMPIGVRFNW